MKENKYIDWNLLVRHMNGELSEEEKNLLETWIESDSKHKQYYERMIAEWNSDKLPERDLPRILSNFDSLLREQKNRRLQIRRRKIQSWSVAATLLFAIGSIALLYQNRHANTPETPVVSIIPGQSKAFLVLHDGTNISLDNAVDSTDLVIGATNIRNSKGTVSLSNTNNSPAPEYNTLVIPRNGEYHIVLNDGTEIWLNAESKLKFPTNFTSGERRVELSGEAYFKVAHDTHHPFYVETDLGNVKVYGTEFNVRHYADESAIRTTLVSGSVGFRAKEDETDNYVKIEPGYQISYENGEEPIIKKIKVANEIAWHKQLFSFENRPLGEIMKDIARWYDVNVTFNKESLKDIKFTCTLDRYDEIKKLLRFFEEVYDIKFIVQGKNITVMEK